MTKRFVLSVLTMVLLVSARAMAEECSVCAEPTQRHVRICVDRTRTQVQLATDGNYTIDPRWYLLSNRAPAGAGRTETDIILLNFGRTMSGGQVLAEMERLGLRPVDLTELLSIGAQRPELQVELSGIIALGATARFGGYTHNVLLGAGWSSRERFILYQRIGDLWGPKRHFAAVRK